MPDATIGLVGRAAERAELEAFVDGVASGPATLTLEAEAGMGKTTLWAWAVALARERGWRVLSAQPVEAEVRLPFAVLGDSSATSRVKSPTTSRRRRPTRCAWRCCWNRHARRSRSAAWASR